MAEIKPMTENEIDDITRGASHYAPSVQQKLWQAKMEISRLKMEEAAWETTNVDLATSVAGLEADVVQLRAELKEARRDRGIAQRKLAQLRIVCYR